MIDFGDYVEIEQKRYGCDNEMYAYKVVAGGMRSNNWIPVPVDANNTGPDFVGKGGKVVDVIRAICCGVCEDKVEKFRLCDVRKLDNFGKRENKEFTPELFPGTNDALDKLKV